MFNTIFNLKDEVILEFVFILSVILIVSCNTEFKVNRNNPVLIQTYPIPLDRPVCFNCSI